VPIGDEAGRINIWYGLFLGNGADALAPRLRIQQSFLRAYAAAGQPINMAVFSKAETKDRAHEVTLYFSPAAATFAKSLSGAAPCEKPTREGVGLEVGDQRCWDLLFPKR
jgi:hypothetical protein